MSSASIPPPRQRSSKGSNSAPRSTPRYTFFWPMLILLLGSGTLAFYQVQSLADQLDEVTRAVERLDPTVKHAKYEKAKFYAIARDLVRLAPKDAVAAQIVDQTGLHTLQRTNPALMSLDNPSGFTNIAPVDPAAVSNFNTPGTGTGPSELLPAPSTK
jgi:Flp pilus assembly protein TadG